MLNYCVRLEIFTTLKIHAVIICVLIPSSLVGWCCCFVGTYCLHVQAQFWTEDGDHMLPTLVPSYQNVCSTNVRNLCM